MANDWNTIEGTEAADKIAGTKANDLIYGFGGNDVIKTGTGDDIVIGGQGGDRIWTSNGNDIVWHTVNTESDATDRYDGGRDYDTIVLNFTVAQWDQMLAEGSTFAADIARLETALLSGRSFRFESLNLEIKNFEALFIVVDEGADAPAIAADDAFTLSEDATPTALDVLANDEAEDGIATVEIVVAPAAGSVTIDGTVVTFDPGTDFAYLAAGESAEIAFTYAITDADGDRAEAVATVTVEGENDAPQPVDVALTIKENESDLAAFTIERTDQTFTNAGSFYVLDFATGDVTLVGRGPDRLLPGDVAPTDGAVFYFNGNTTNWFAEAHIYSEGVARAIDPSLFQLSGYDGETLLRDASLYLLEGGSDVSLTIEVPSTLTPQGEASITFTATGLAYEPNTTRAVSAETLTIAVVPVGTGPVSIAPDVTDADAGDTTTLSIDTTATQGSVKIAADGTFSYDQGDAFGYLAVGETAVDTFDYTATDASGAFDTATVSVTIEGTNDAPDAQALTAETFAEVSDFAGFGAASAGIDVPNAGYFYVVDLDAGTVTPIAREIGRLQLADVAPQNGLVVHINPNTLNLTIEAAVYEQGVETFLDPQDIVPGNYTGEANTYQTRLMLNDGFQDLDYTIEVAGVATPSGLADISLTIADIDYAGPGHPIEARIGGASVETVASEVDTSVTVEAEATDRDASDTFTFTVDTSETQGAVTNNSDGTFSYSSNDAFLYLLAGETAIDTFTYTTDDGNGGTDVETVTVEVLGVTNDEPVAIL